MTESQGFLPPGGSRWIAQEKNTVDAALTVRLDAVAVNVLVRETRKREGARLERCSCESCAELRWALSRLESQRLNEGGS